jgi:hypothetical protein
MNPQLCEKGHGWLNLDGTCSACERASACPICHESGCMGNECKPDDEMDFCDDCGEPLHACYCEED